MGIAILKVVSCKLKIAIRILNSSILFNGGLDRVPLSQSHRVSLSNDLGSRLPSKKRTILKTNKLIARQISVFQMSIFSKK